MGKPIDDEFSALPISRERKYQLRRRKEGRCRACGKEAFGKTFCGKHGRLILEKRRKNGRYDCYKTLTLALSNGTIIRGNCWCGKLGQAHHKDYSKPLEVDWLCNKHHNDIHGWKTTKERPVKVANLRQYNVENQRRYRRQKQERRGALTKQEFGNELGFI